jgi:hypothetical protein
VYVPPRNAFDPEQFDQADEPGLEAQAGVAANAFETANTLNNKGIASLKAIRPFIEQTSFLFDRS